MNEKLKPCPFCGSIDVWVTPVAQLRPFAEHPARVVARCSNCQAQSRERWSETEVAIAWNRRANTLPAGAGEGEG